MERRTKYKAKAKSSPNWLQLPREVTLSIIEKLDAVDILGSVQRVCTQWKSICKVPSLWKTIIFRNECKPFWYLEIMCKQAVDYSCGGLTHLDITTFGNDELLDYITGRCTKIRCLRLVRVRISGVGLSKAAERLPLLEDLEISYCDRATAKALYIFGKSCPLLKSLKLNRQGEDYPLKDDREAFVIAYTMVELRYLQLFGNRLTNKGLKAILDSCSHLESLDLRQCFNTRLEESSLGTICADKFKHFRAPYDSTDDYEFDATLQYSDYDDGPLSSRDVDYGCDYGSD